MDRLLAPTLTNEFGREPVEQFGMRGRRALQAEIVLGLDQAATEIRLPKPIDPDARRERICRIDQPLRQLHPIGFRTPGRDIGEHGRHAGRYCFSGAREIALSQKMRLARLVPLANDHRSHDVGRPF